MSPEVFHQPWSFFMRYLSSEQAALNAMNGVCFERLILGSSVLVDMYQRSCAKAPA